MKWVFIIIGAILLLPVALWLLKGIIRIVAWLLVIALIFGGVVFLINGDILYGILSLAGAGLLSFLLPKIDDSVFDAL